MINHQHMHGPGVNTREHVHHADGVGTTRHHGEHTRPGGKQTVVATVVGNAILEAHPRSMHGQGDRARVRRRRERRR